MRRLFFLSLLSVIVVVTLNANWSNIRESALTIDNEIIIRYESSYQDVTIHQISHYTDQGWSDIGVTSLSDSTFQATTTYDNLTEQSLSFRIEDENDINIIPGFAYQTPDNLEEMTGLSQYPRNTEITDHLNIAGEKMLLSDERIFFALTNYGGGFPVSGSLFTIFFSYTISIFPDTDSIPDYVYSLIYTVDLLGIISPGLFKIDSATEDLTLIGPVVTSIDNTTNTLYISCLIADLMADDDFANAYSPYMPLKVVAMTQRISNFGQTVTLMDEGNYHNIYMQKHTLSPTNNSEPVISNIMTTVTEGLTVISLDYFDFEANFPLTHDLETDTGSIYQFYPYGTDFSQSVIFMTALNEEWNSATIRFSDDNIVFVEQDIYNTKPQRPENLNIELIDNDVLLSWNAVTQDTQGNPVNVDHYKIFCSITDPVEDGFFLLAIVDDPTYLHQQGAETSDRAFYRIIAVMEQ